MRLSLVRPSCSAVGLWASGRSWDGGCFSSLSFLLTSWELCSSFRDLCQTSLFETNELNTMSSEQHPQLKADRLHPGPNRDSGHIHQLAPIVVDPALNVVPWIFAVLLYVQYPPPASSPIRSSGTRYLPPPFRGIVPPEVHQEPIPALRALCVFSSIHSPDRSVLKKTETPWQGRRTWVSLHSWWQGSVGSMPYIMYASERPPDAQV